LAREIYGDTFAVSVPVVTKASCQAFQCLQQSGIEKELFDAINVRK
jgi:hypothetical protein